MLLMPYKIDIFNYRSNNLKKYLKVFLSILLSFAFITYFLNYIDINEIIHLLKGVNFKLLLVCFVIYFVFTILRSIRIKILINNKLILRQIIPILLTYNLLNLIIPFRLGELSYIFLLKRTKVVSSALAFSSLVYIRLLDIFFLFVLFCVFIPFVNNFMVIFLPNNTIGISFIIIVIFMSLICLYYSTNLRNLLRKLASYSFRNFSFKKLIDYCISVLDIIESYKLNNTLKVSNLLTFFIWILIFVFYYLLSLSIGTALSFFDFSLCVLLINLTGLLPIQGVAGFGTFEGAVILGQISFGVPLNDAISLSFSLHILYLFHLIFFGIFGLVFTALYSK